MSDNQMIIIPADPLALPPEATRQALLDMLRRMRPDVDDYEMKVSETPEFFCCMGNFEGVFCPFCAADIKEAWGDLMDAWWKSADRSVLDIETPCCGKPTTLNDLDYQWPQGFARFGIELMNPWGDLEPEEVAAIEALLGQPIRIIWVHI